jgi:general secretion pathway protein E
MMLQTRKNDELGFELVRVAVSGPEGPRTIHRTVIQKQENLTLSEVLLRKALVSAENLRGAMGAILNVPVVDLKHQVIDVEVLKYIPQALARRHRALPLELKSNILLVAMANPDDLRALEDLKSHARVRLQPALADPAELNDAIDRCYKATSEIYNHLQNHTQPATSGGAVPAQPAQSEEALVQTSVVRTLELLLTQAVRDRVSDVHIEPQPDRLRVRYRIDGVLHEVISLPSLIHSALVSRIKILGSMNIAERRLPQDGQFNFKGGGKEVDIRVASVETTYGERVVLRLLDKTNSVLSLPDLGFLPEALAQYQALLRAPYGMILVSGPTGSGKTTTLYASVNSIDHLSKNVVTIEDPVEYQFGGISQIQVNAKAGLTFASGIRAIMRHDPDVILVGEIRDADTAQTAVQASLTGHLVLSSIHANNTEGVVHRLVNLGVDPFLASASLLGVVAQRMIRKVCPHCAVQVEIPRAEQVVYEQEMGESGSMFSYGQGCQNCASTGYRGRTGVFEILTMTDNLRAVFAGNREPGALQQQAIKDGMVTLVRDGFIKAKLGISTPAEVLRNLYSVG